MILSRLLSHQCRVLKVNIGNGSFQRTKWTLLQKIFPNRNFATFTKNIPANVLKTLKKSPANKSPISTRILSSTAGLLLCGAGLSGCTAYVFSATPSVIFAKSESESVRRNDAGTDTVPSVEDIADIVGGYIDQAVPTLKWRQFLEIVSSEALLLLSAVMCAVSVAVININIPLLLGDIINVLTHCSATVSSTFLQEIRKPAQKLLFYYLAQGAWTFSYIALISKVGENIARKLRMRLFTALMHQDIAFYDKQKTGDIIQRLTADIQEFKSSFKQCMSQGLKAVTQTVGCTIALIMVSPQLSVAMLSILPCVMIVGTVLGTELRRFSRRAQDQIAQATGVASEAINNVRTVRAFAMEPNEISLYDKETKKASKLNMKLNYGVAVFQALTNIAVNGIILGVLFSGGYLMSRDVITPGDLMSFLVATQTIQKSLTQMSVLVSQAVRGASAGGRVIEFIALTPKLPLTGGIVIPYHSLNGHVGFKDISFSYPTRPDAVVLKDFNLDITGGQTVALVGPSGGGKSTVAALLERFYDPTSGVVSVDGHDIKDVDASWLRGRAIGFINQEPVLFNTTVMENIRYGRPTATDPEVLEAASLANAHSFILDFPNGYQTMVGERGVTLSGGQKQRVAIARALIKHPSILILDEATSALDAESEKVVQEALDRVSKGRTVIVIAHRLSTIKNADVIAVIYDGRIVEEALDRVSKGRTVIVIAHRLSTTKNADAVISDGRIAEQGTHDSLTRKQGMYWELIRQQSSDNHTPKPTKPVTGTLKPVTETPKASELGTSLTTTSDTAPIIIIKRPPKEGVFTSIYNFFTCKDDE